MRHRPITSTPTGLDRPRNSVQCFDFVDQGAKVGKAGNTFAFEFVLPSNHLDDLVDELGQPAERGSFVERDVVGWRLQESATLSDQSLQMKFNGLPVKQDDRTRI